MKLINQVGIALGALLLTWLLAAQGAGSSPKLTVEHINPKLMEGLPSGDLMFLQDLYRRVNETGHSRLAVTCPHCQGNFEVETSPVGES